ncbi:hypothetical protein, partial [Nocardia abscessus]|uniref:hypothetical protein n=1 Tax=Nocardia abscessus TaxID=120957 RepID=UPI0024572194
TGQGHRGAQDADLLLHPVGEQLVPTRAAFVRHGEGAGRRQLTGEPSRGPPPPPGGGGGGGGEAGGGGGGRGGFFGCTNFI